MAFWGIQEVRGQRTTPCATFRHNFFLSAKGNCISVENVLCTRVLHRKDVIAVLVLIYECYVQTCN